MRNKRTNINIADSFLFGAHLYFVVEMAQLFQATARLNVRLRDIIYIITI